MVIANLVTASVENIHAPLSSDDIRNAVFSANNSIEDLEQNLAFARRFAKLLA